MKTITEIGRDLTAENGRLASDLGACAAFHVQLIADGFSTDDSTLRHFATRAAHNARAFLRGIGLDPDAADEVYANAVRANAETLEPIAQSLGLRSAR